jgi:hypothetical protein
MLDYLKEDQEAMRLYGLPSLFVFQYFIFQYNLIARIDDTCQFLVSSLQITDLTIQPLQRHNDFDFVQPTIKKQELLQVQTKHPMHVR